MSRYSKLLATIIAESNCTAKEIVEKCNKMGNGIDTTRLSKLQSGKLSAPSEKVSRDLAKACNVDERKLVIEGYLEKAPKEIVDAFQILKNQSIIAGLKMFNSSLPKSQIEKLKEAMDEEPLSDCIIEILDTADTDIDVDPEEIDFHTDDFKFTLKEPVGIQVKDNAMFPIIPENSKVIVKLQEKYDDGDILALKTSPDSNIIFRYAFFNNNTIILKALNKESQKLMYPKDKIIILGKVERIIIDI